MIVIRLFHAWVDNRIHFITVKVIVIFWTSIEPFRQSFLILVALVRES